MREEVEDDGDTRPTGREVTFTEAELKKIDYEERFKTQLFSKNFKDMRSYEFHLMMSKPQILNFCIERLQKQGAAKGI